MLSQSYHQIPRGITAGLVQLPGDACSRKTFVDLILAKVRSSRSAEKGLCFCRAHTIARTTNNTASKFSPQSKEKSRNTFILSQGVGSSVIKSNSNRKGSTEALCLHSVKRKLSGIGARNKENSGTFLSVPSPDYHCLQKRQRNWWGKTASNAEDMILSDSSRLLELPGVSCANSEKTIKDPPCTVKVTDTNGAVEDSLMSNDNELAVFQPRKVLILTKMSRLEFERRKNQDLNKDQLQAELKQRGSDYSGLLERHNQHKIYLNTIKKELEAHGIEHRLVQRWDYTDENVDWADAVFTAGGDGTFLLGASKIRDTNKPLIGINTDPISSEGYLCLMKKLPESHFCDALNKLLSGNFRWLWRQRIRVSISGKDMWEDPVELHDQQLLYPEYRWSDHIQEGESSRLRSHSSPRTPYITPRPPDSNLSGVDQLASGWNFVNGVCASNGDSVFASNGDNNGDMEGNGVTKERMLPFLALNDVYIGESLSSRVSYYELKVDEGPKVKQKSSGITICTGTGSTSWHFNTNKLTDQCVSDLMKIMASELNVTLPTNDPDVVSKICRKFNDKLLFSPSDLRVAYTVRDPVYNATFQPIAPRGFANTIRVKSRCFDAHLVVDGGMSYLFNDGAKAKLELRPEDALRTVVFR